MGAPVTIDGSLELGSEGQGGPPSFAGDANCDGAFDSGDLVQAFQGGKYNSGKKASWAEGDWNQDDLFDPADMVAAFTHGRYGKGRPDDVPRGHGPCADHDRPNQGQSAVIEISVNDDGDIVITSTKDLSNIVYRVPTDDGHMDTKIDDLEGMSYTLQVEEGVTITDIWVKSGNNRSGDGPGYGQHFVWSDDAGSWVPAEPTPPGEGDPPTDGDPPCDGEPNGPPDDVPRGHGRPDDVPRGHGPCADPDRPDRPNQGQSAVIEISVTDDGDIVIT
jgi:hypothetical protein